MRREGFPRLWRGAPAMVAASVPSHAAYFSAYEAGKVFFGADAPGHHPLAAAASGACATLLHDAVLTPMDVVKQRLQLGFYSGIGQCLRSVLREEGLAGLYRSYPTTVLMNIPYAAVVVSTNESIKKALVSYATSCQQGDNSNRAAGSSVSQAPSLWVYMVSGAGAGALGAAATCPLDVVKTRLQTASLVGRQPPLGSTTRTTAAAATMAAANSTSSSSSSSSMVSAGASSVGSASLRASSASSSLASLASASSVVPSAGLLRTVISSTVAAASTGAHGHAGAGPLAGSSSAAGAGMVMRATLQPVAKLYTASNAAAAPGPPGGPGPRLRAMEVARQLWREEGAAGFFKGVRARMLVHTPSMAISWSTYEAVKMMLQDRFPATPQR